jgi:phage host-nuclease inhibitor protein Gam
VSAVELLKTFDDVNAVLLNIAALQLHADKKETEMNKKILDIKKLHEPDIKELKDKIVHYEDQLSEFCKANKKEFASSRSRELTYGRIGFRHGKSALKLISKKFTWEYVKEKFQTLFNTKYINVETTLNKTKILADADREILTADQLLAAGCKVVKGESSYYEINWDEIKLVDAK